MYLEEICQTLSNAARVLAIHTAQQKNTALQHVIEALSADRNYILSENEKDVKKARADGMKESLIDRLSLSQDRIDGMIEGIRVIINQKDPIGEVVSGWTHPQGMDIRQVRTPLGVAAIIYESRPNVTIDAFSLAYKSGNAILLRGSSSALHSNRALVDAIVKGLKNAGANAVCDAVALADSGNRSDVDWILKAHTYINILLPRGGSELIRHVIKNAQVPVIETGSGICHLYVDAPLDASYIESAARIADNAKNQKPGACNAIEVLLIHKDSAIEFFPLLLKTFAAHSAKTGVAGGVRYRCCELSYPLLQAAQAKVHLYSAMQEETIQLAGAEDFDCEFLDYTIAIKIVDSFDEAVTHINAHNTSHSESIVTQNTVHARRFQKEIDAACVYVNVSTRFTDGAEFGFGAELGISTQKLHARGPMGLTALTTTKYFIEGNGQIR